MNESLKTAMTIYGMGMHTGTNITYTPHDCQVMFDIIQKATIEPGCRIFEFAGGGGMSATCIRQAMYQPAEFTTVEVEEHKWDVLEAYLKGWGNLIKGDIRDQLDEVPEEIDVLVIDADHSKECANWYMDNLLPRVVSGGYCILHDMCDLPGHDDEYFTVLTRLSLDEWEVIDRTYFDEPCYPDWEPELPP